MTDFSNLKAHEVRANETLMRQYIKEYAAVFGKEPNCVSCSFKSDYKRFQQKLKTPKNIPMKNTFKLKKKEEAKIHTYRVNKRPRRVYGHSMNEEFAREYLKYGTEDEIAERKKFFEALPKSEEETTAKAPKEAEVKDSVKQMNLKELGKHVEGVSDVEELNTLLQEEQAADPRKGAVSIITDRINEVSQE